MYHYPPKVEGDTIEYAPIKGLVPPPTHVGYVRDPANLWRQTSEWRPCADRNLSMRPRKCGRALITMYCQCRACPLFGRIVKPDDCEDCDHATGT